MNLQIVLTFVFDVFIANIKFSEYELMGCGLLIMANMYLIMVKLFCSEDPAKVVHRNNKHLELIEETEEEKEETPMRKTQQR